MGPCGAYDCERIVDVERHVRVDDQRDGEVRRARVRAHV